MSKVLVTESSLQNIANAIRAKNGSSDTYTPAQMATAISQLQTGPRLVDNPKLIFIDYDGSTISQYTYAEAQALTALPANPTHTGLTSQGWNWTLAEIKAQLTAYPDQAVYVGQMYVTTSGDTEIDTTFVTSQYLSPVLSLSVNGTVTISWGDGTTADTLTGSSLSTKVTVGPHTYSQIGNYTIKIHVVSGTFKFNNNPLVISSSSNENRIYADCIKQVRLGNGITSLGSSAFYTGYSLTSITMPNTITDIQQNAFWNCISLKSITIPTLVTTIGDSALCNCSNLNSISLPNGLTSLNADAFAYTSIREITLPAGLSYLGNGVFSHAQLLMSLTIPNTITEIPQSLCISDFCLTSVTLSNTVTSIGKQAFYSCPIKSINFTDNLTTIGQEAFRDTKLKSIIIPRNVTNIGNLAFVNNYTLASITVLGSSQLGNNAFSYNSYIIEYHFSATTPPTIGTTIFSGISSNCKIYVPSASLSAYQSATGWSDYASYMVGE